MDRQDVLDRAFRVTPEDREALRSGKIPPSIRRQLRFMSRSSSLSGGAPSAILLATLAGIGLGLLTLPARDGRVFVLLAVLALPLALMVRVRFLDWRHERNVLAARPRLRVLEGPAETVRTWNYGYGECYHLFTELRFIGQSEKPVYVSDRLRSWTLSGWARLFLVTVPRRKGFLSPYSERPVALEIREDTAFVEREPGKPPPEKPMLVNVPAD